MQLQIPQWLNWSFLLIWTSTFLMHCISWHCQHVSKSSKCFHVYLLVMNITCKVVKTWRTNIFLLSNFYWSAHRNLRQRPIQRTQPRILISVLWILGSSQQHTSSLSYIIKTAGEEMFRVPQTNCSEDDNVSFFNPTHRCTHTHTHTHTHKTKNLLNAVR